MVEKITRQEVSFEEMSEEQAVKAFQDDGYFNYVKRQMRYGKFLPRDSIWATAPATMFVAFYENKPVGVIGFAEHKGALLMAGTHVRDEYRGRGLSSILLEKLLEEKGTKTLYANPVSERFASTLKKYGFKNMERESLPKDIQEELKGVNYPEQLQKWFRHEATWFMLLKKEEIT